MSAFLISLSVAVFYLLGWILVSGWLKAHFDKGTFDGELRQVPEDEREVSIIWVSVGLGVLSWLLILAAVGDKVLGGNPLSFWSYGWSNPFDA